MVENRIRFTKATLDALPPPEKGARRYFDEKTPGLVLRVTAGGARVFYLYKKVNGRPQEIRIGAYPTLSVEAAQRQAKILAGQIEQGDDPAAKRREARSAATFSELFEWYVAQPKKGGERSARTIAEYRRYIGTYLAPIAKKRPAEIKPGELEALFMRVGRDHGPYAANRALALAKAVFNKAIRKGLVKGSNPAAGVEPHREESRDRRLMPGEIERFLAAVAEEPNETIRDYMLLSLLCGARKANMLSMAWADVDLVAGVWRIGHTKNGTAQTIPLLDAELEILKRRRLASASPWVFPGYGATGHLTDPKHGWKRILERAGIQNLRIHDLRRSLASFMVDSNVSMAVIGSALNHKSAVVTQIYARLSLDPIRAAKQAAHGIVAAASERAALPPPANVVPLAAAGAASTRERRPAARR